MTKRYLYITHRIFLDEVNIKKGGADYIIDSISSNNFVYVIELKLNEYSEYKKNINIIRVSIKYKTRNKIVYLKSFSNINFFFKFMHEFFLVNFFLLKTKKKYEISFSINPINSFYLIPIIFFGITKKNYFHIVDYSDIRFHSFIVNKLYHWMFFLSIKTSHLVGYVSKSISRLNFYDKKKFFFIPNTPDINFLYPPYRKKIYDLVYLVPKFDNQTNWNLLIRCLLILKKFKCNFKFVITGNCDRKNLYYLYFRNKISSLGLKKNIVFVGYIHNRDLISNILLKSRIGITCYNKNFSTNYSHYADSLKIRDYAGHGLPVISEGLFYNSIEAKQLRFCLLFRTSNEFLNYFIKLSNTYNYKNFSRNAFEHHQNLNKKVLLKSLFIRLSK